MGTPLLKIHHHGTERCMRPQETLDMIRAHLPALGITRCADVTGLDFLGVPVYSAVRPQGALFQLSFGKGIDTVSAQVSALMEAAELFHYENPPPTLRRASAASLKSEGSHFVSPRDLPQFIDSYFNDDFLIDWCPATDLIADKECWLPASAACIADAMLHEISTNGLASGNHPVEATLHAINELVERAAIASVVPQQRLDLSASRAVDLNTVDNEDVRRLCEAVQSKGLKVVLLQVESCIPVHTFWCVLLDENPYATASTTNMGWGTHRNPSVAATRAITEAAQSRLSFIYGGREDFARKQAYRNDNGAQRIRERFLSIVGDTSWDKFVDSSANDLMEDYRWTLQELAQAGFEHVYRVDLSRAPYDVPVVKVVIPGLAANVDLC